MVTGSMRGGAVMSGALLTFDSDGQITSVRIMADTDIQQARVEQTLRERGILDDSGTVLREMER